MVVKRIDRVSVPAIVGIILSASLFIVCGVLLILAMIRRFRRKRLVDAASITSKSPSTDFEISVLEKGIIHPPPTEKMRVQKPVRLSSFTGDQLATDTHSCDVDDQDPEPGEDEEMDTDSDVKAEDKENQHEPAVQFGTLHFSVKYNFEKNALTIVVLRCENLSATAHSKTLDPYVKLQLLPDKQHRAKTRVLRHTNNPVYNEEFTFFGLTYNQLQSMIIHFGIISFDRYSRDEVLGELLCPLSMIDLSQSDQETLLAKEITTRPKTRSLNRGEVLLSLCYQPTANRLTCVILKAKGLPRKNIMDLADPYIKLYLICNGQRIAKKKTHVKNHTLNPVFNESFIFDLPSSIQNLEGVSLELLLLDFDRLTKNEVIGRLELGSNALIESARKQWMDITSSPRRQIAQWHKLTE